MLLIVDFMLLGNDGDIHDVEDVVPDDTFIDSSEIGQDSC